jgi:hypothetical protein
LANEKECRDSDGKRERSSAKLGVAGPPVSDKLPALAAIALIEVDRDKAATEGLREEARDPGSVGFLDGGRCCLIRRRPERPKPCSWSVMMGDL